MLKTTAKSWNDPIAAILIRQKLFSTRQEEQTPATVFISHMQSSKRKIWQWHDHSIIL